MMAFGEKEGHSESTVGLPRVVQANHTFPATDRSSHRETRRLLNTGPPQDEAPGAAVLIDGHHF